MASILGDYSQGIRRALTKQLLNEDAKKPTLQESIWTHLKSTLSAGCFTELLKQDTRKLHEYVDLVTEEAKLDFIEEKNLSEAMTTRDFNFTFQVAIDAYPQKLPSGRSRELPPNRKGVLTFYIQGTTPETKAAEEAADLVKSEVQLAEAQASTEMKIDNTPASNNEKTDEKIDEKTDEKTDEKKHEKKHEKKEEKNNFEKKKEP
jgi:hypothetical protein